MSSHTPYGATLRERREAAGLTQYQLADRAHTSQQYLSLIERGALHPREALRNRIDDAIETALDEAQPADFGPFGNCSRLVEKHRQASRADEQATA